MNTTTNATTNTATQRNTIPDLLIVGAGILGLSAAIQAAKAGLKVRLFEKDAAPVGASRRNFGMLASSTITNPSSIWRQHALASRQFYQDIQQHSDISLCQRDGLYLAGNSTELALLQEFASLCGNYGIHSQMIDPAYIAAHYGYLDASRLQGGMLLNGDYSVEPDRVANALLQYARHQQHIEIMTNACVTQVHSEAQAVRLVLADGQQFMGKKLLICHGETTDLLYPQLLRQSGIQRCTLQMALTAPAPYQLNASLYSGLSLRRYPAFEICPGFDSFMQQPVAQIVQDYGIHVLVKQTANGGLIIGDSHEYRGLEQPPQYHQMEAVNQFIVDYCRDTWGMQLPPVQQRWNGYYLSHPSQLALLNQPEPNVFIASAIAGKGMTTGPGFMLDVLQQHIF